jgi:Family of unknown function (DUF5832)
MYGIRDYIMAHIDDAVLTLAKPIATPEGQTYAVISVVSPSQTSSGSLAVVIRGVFATPESAKAWAESQHDGKFDIFIVKAGEWFPLPPDYDRIDDVKYNDERLEQLMSGHLESQRAARREMERRIAHDLENTAGSSSTSTA